MSHYDTVLKNLFIDKLADIKMGMDVVMDLTLFFKEGHVSVSPENVGYEKEKSIQIFHDLVFKLQPEAYAITSDTNIRSATTGDIIGEQLMSILIGKDSQITTHTRQYRRGESITFIEPTEIDPYTKVGGRLTEFYTKPSVEIPGSPSPDVLRHHFFPTLTPYSNVKTDSQRDEPSIH